MLVLAREMGAGPPSSTIRHTAFASHDLSFVLFAHFQLLFPAIAVKERVPKIIEHKHLAFAKNLHPFFGQRLIAFRQVSNAPV